MEKRKLYLNIVLLLFFFSFVYSQESTLELPVQLVGFPFIIGSVRLTNFIKKLSYSLSPGLYNNLISKMLYKSALFSNWTQIYDF